MNLGEQLGMMRDRVPEAAGIAAQLLIDNPGQFGLIAAGTIVGTKALCNLVRPRTMVEALALVAVADVAAAVLIRRALVNGWLKFRVRDLDGHLVPLVFPRESPAALSPCPISGCPGHAAGS